MHLLALFLFNCSLLFKSLLSSDNLNLRPRQLINAVQSGRRFGGVPLASTEGSTERESDHFKLLACDRNSLMVGARDAVYNLSMASMEVQHTIEWAPNGRTVEDCLMKGKSRLECHNYIRVMVLQANGRCLICGTYAFSPKCREYVYSGDEHSLQQRRQFDGQAISPYDPKDNSTAVFIAETSEIYTGTVSDFAGNDPLIYRKRLSDDDGLRTQRDDLKVLDSPNFVASFAYGAHVYFWYREWAAEATDGDRQVYARVARVCKGDRGGARPAHDRWTSFVKARLNCSYPGKTPFYFNELQAVTEPVPAGDGSTIVYAVFTTPQSIVRMSAVCAFRMEAIKRVFDYGHFKVQQSAQSLWMPYRSHQMISVPRPGSCVADSSKLPESTVSFITRNPLMHEAVPATHPRPILVQGPERSELTQIAVAAQIRSVRGALHNALYLGTSDGRVLKVIDPGDGTTSLIESTRVFTRSVPVVNLMATSDQLVVVSADEIAAIPLYNCGEQRTCSGCVHLQDAHCAWDLDSARCVGRSDGSWAGGNFVQNVNIGRSEQCPEGAVDPDYYAVDELHSERAIGSDQQPTQFTTQALLLAVLITLAVASAGGFFVGYRISRWRLLQDGRHHSSGSSTGSDYDSYGRARLTRHDSLTTAKIEHVYGTTPSKDAVSLVLTMPQNGTALMSSLSNGGSGVVTPKISTERNMLASLSNSTLPRDYKVKKVYL
uniref:Semaphorin-1A n=1 Tax=Ascaris suum TaxID=6253 RepID=F1KUC0_ASCSU